MIRALLAICLVIILGAPLVGALFSLQSFVSERIAQALVQSR